jgi:ABC-2 type transport system ATP-binding protein
MPEGHVLEFTGVTKRFGPVTAVDGFSARVEPGVVTGFLGPNGAGKTTSLRILLGLIAATEGTATIGGKRYAQLAHPLQTVGAALEASSFHPGRSAANHLTVYAHAAGIPAARVDDALGAVGLADVAGRKVGGFSLGMRQRLGLAYTLLGDPGVLVLDEPSNGLDPEGIKWMRGFLRELANQGRTVLVSSHLLAEIQQTAQSLLIIARGRLVFQGSLGELTAQDEYATVVDAPDRAALVTALTDAGLPFEQLRTGLAVRGAETTAVGAIAAAAGIALSTLQRRGPALEEVFLDLVNGVRVHESALAPSSGDPVAAPEAAEAEAGVAEEAAAVEPEEPAAERADEAGTTDAPEPDTDAAADADEAGAPEAEESTEDAAEFGPPAPTWDADHPTTDADVEADRFFSQYDAPAGDAAPPADAETEPDAEPDTDADAEGGEQR